MNPCVHPTDGALAMGIPTVLCPAVYLVIISAADGKLIVLSEQGELVGLERRGAAATSE